MARSATPKLARGEALLLTGTGLDQRVRSFAAELDYVYRSLRRQGISAVDAEDLAQEVFLIAWRRRADFDRTRPLRPWLAGIAFKLAHHHRQRRPREIPATEVLEAEPAPEPPEAALDTRALVLQVLTNLPERHRLVLVRHELDGLTVQDLARSWGVPRFTVYTRLRRARRAFVQEMHRLQAVQSGGRTVAAAALLGLGREGPFAKVALRERLRRWSSGQPVSRAPPLRRWVPVAGLGACLCLTVALLARVSAPARPARAGEPARLDAGRGPAVHRGIRRGLRPVRLITPAPAAQGRALPADELARDLTGFWPFDDDPGSLTAADLSPGGQPCLLRGLDPDRAFIPGARGGALELGYQGWLECPQPELPPRRTAALTVAVWVKREGRPRLHRALAMRPMDGVRANYFFFGFAGDSLVVSSSGWGGALAAPFLETGRWVHVAFTHDADHMVRLYIDGVEVARRRTSARRFGPVNGPLRVGAGLLGSHRDQMGQRFDGAMDELRVYERALSEAEIRALAR